NPDESFQSHLDQARAAEVASPANANFTPVLPITSKNSLRLRDLLPFVWLTGLTLFLMRLATAQWLLSRAGHRCVGVGGGRFAEGKGGVAGKLGIRQPVALLLDPRRTIPMTWGIFRPRVLLPAEAANWDEARLHAVLLHEMAHIKRGDAVVQWLVESSC